jgi:hypothetical protein
MTSQLVTDENWQIQKLCTDIQDYELIVEKQKTDWACEQKRESWKWIVSYHGSVVSSGSVNSQEEAQNQAVANLPLNDEAVKDSDCDCS